ncbi:unnamed protein product [Lasius platythorax]|uniref:Uncharacterized protein n=1 Tax=Lasius platythorax TaxID=488582 RepID=A0AAV2MZX6_9HYME
MSGQRRKGGGRREERRKDAFTSSSSSSSSSSDHPRWNKYFYTKKSEEKVRQAQAALRKITSQAEDAMRCVQGLRLQIEQQTLHDPPQMLADLNSALERAERNLVGILCKQTGAEQRLQQVKHEQGLESPLESPDELFASDSSISF